MPRRGAGAVVGGRVAIVWHSSGFRREPRTELRTTGEISFAPRVSAGGLTTEPSSTGGLTPSTITCPGRSIGSGSARPSTRRETNASAVNGWAVSRLNRQPDVPVRIAPPTIADRAA